MFNFNCDIKNPIFLIWKSEKANRSMKRQLISFKKYVINNKFISEKSKEEIFLEVDTILRTTYLIKKYANLWLVNYINRKPSVNCFDLELDEICEKRKDVITYIDLDARRKYLFSQKDFTKLIKSNLENSYMYDHLPQPLTLRNPYTNNEFKIKDLIEIDKMLINSPLIWKMFKDCYYNIERFKIINYTYLTVCCTGSFVDQLDRNDIIFYIEDIFMNYNIQNYCNECLGDVSIIRNTVLRDILTNWFLYQKRLAIFTQSNLNSLCKMFKMDCSNHRKDSINHISFKMGVINVEFTGGSILTNYVFVANLEESKPKYKKLKTKKKPKNVLKKKAVIKTI